MWLFKKPENVSKQGLMRLKWGDIWYELSGATKNAPLVVLHGGPGFPHNYLKPLSELSDVRPILFYDQFGCGKSGRSDNASLWTVERFVDELAAIIKKLGLREYHLLGHSWGTALALEYALRKPRGLKSTIMASPYFSTPLWIRDLNVHRKGMPEKTQEILDRNERAGTFYTEEFMRATEELYAKHVYRKRPHHPDYLEAARGMGIGVYNAMWGPTEFVMSGVLRDYDRTDQLKELTVPTLLTCGRWDEARPETVEFFASKIPGAQVKIFENSAHMPHLEEADLYIQAVRDFLGGV